jgi:Tfp pilus assembly PilM family ATPase/Tfp pilus assembly protein PilN
MPKSRVALGVELIGESGRLVLVENGEQGLRVLSTQTVRVGEELNRALRALSRRPAEVVCSVPLENAAMRILNLPPTTDENLERVVGLEAEGTLPLQADELAFAHHVLGMTDQSRLDVLLAAARQSAVQENLRKVNTVPWISASNTVSAVAIFNALQHVRGAAREPLCAVLRVEEAGSELLVLDRARMVVAQAIPLGCSVDNEVLVPQPVAAGGERGALATASGSASPWIVALAQQVRYALQAVAYERGTSIERLYLCGAGAAIDGADWQLSERLDVPLTILAPDDTRASAAYTVAYGCALQAADVAAMPLRLSLSRVTVAREVEQRRQVRISWGALVTSVVVAGSLVVAAMFHQKNVELEQVESKLREFRGTVPVPSMSAEDLSASLADITVAQDMRVPAAQALSTLSRQLPQGTWLTELSYNAASGCVARGYSLEPNGAQRAQIALLRQGIFDEVTLDYRTEDAISKVPVWGFQISCKLKPKVVVRKRQGTRR